jgi:hypothetical protein
MNGPVRGLAGMYFEDVAPSTIKGLSGLAWEIWPTQRQSFLAFEGISRVRICN